MSLLRIVSGWACIVIALVVIAILALGGVDGGAGMTSASSPTLMAHLPGVVFGLALLAPGTRSLKTKSR